MQKGCRRGAGGRRRGAGGVQEGCRTGAHLLHGFSSKHTEDDRHARLLASPQQASSSSIGHSLIMRGGPPHLCERATLAGASVDAVSRPLLTCSPPRE